MQAPSAKTSGDAPPAGRGRGFALPVVLLLLATMSVLAIRLVDQSRTDIVSARALAREAEARNAADAGYATMVVRYLAENRGGPMSFETRIGRAQVSVVATPETGKIDLNSAEPELLAGIFRVLGVEPRRAAQLAQSVAELRESNGRVLRNADELLQFSDVDISLVERVRPYVTVFRANPGVDARVAPRAVLVAIPGITAEDAELVLASRATDAPLPPEIGALLDAYSGDDDPILNIRSTAALDGKPGFVREVVVDLRNPTAPLVLEWRRLDAAGPATGHGLE